MSLEKKVAFNGDAIAISGTISSTWIPLYSSHSYQGVNGYFGGAGTLQLSYQISSVSNPDDNPFATSEGNIATGLTTGSFSYDVAPKVSRFIRLVATETGGGSTITGLYVNFVQQGRGF